MSSTKLSEALIQVRLAELLPAWEVQASRDLETNDYAFRCSIQLGGVIRDATLVVFVADLDRSMLAIEAKSLQPFANSLNRAYQELFDGLVKIEARPVEAADEKGNIPQQ